MLTILADATLADVLSRMPRDALHARAPARARRRRRYRATQAYGLALRGPNDESDVVSGERFCSALAALDDGEIHRPTVVTVASCDSGNVGSVVRAGASFAHALHQGGMPLVVASQFPLCTEGSVPLTATLYSGLLWGAHPLPLMHEIRAELHARYTSRWHDWASLVVYEALPRALDEQLDRVTVLSSQARPRRGAGAHRSHRPAAEGRRGARCAPSSR